MYMASQGHESMGGYDIFISEKKQGQLSTPGNIGFDIYRVTFFGEEKKPVVETEDYLLGSIAQPVKDHNIESTVNVKKKSLTVFKGVTIDAISRKPVEAQIEITDNVTGQIIETF